MRFPVQTSIIPSQASQLDGEEAVKAVQLVRKQEKAFGIAIPAAVLFTRTGAAIRTRDLRRIASQLADGGVPMFTINMVERVPTGRIRLWRHSEYLDTTQVSGIPAARKNARAFATEVVEL